MPDPNHETVSASQAAALWNQSQYCSRWMLYQNFAEGLDISSDESPRMKWGKLIEPVLLAETAKELRLEITPNRHYWRRGLIGATKDATIICPDRGPGVVETKCVFDYSVWAQKWDSGNHIPQEYEVQLQAQMLVGDGDEDSAGDPYEWGVFAVWCCGDVYFYEREPLKDFWDDLREEAAKFMDEVKTKTAPEPFGDPMEIPVINQAFPVVIEGTVMELDDVELGETARRYAWAAEQRKFHAKIEDAAKAKLLGVAEDREILGLPGAYVNIKKSVTKDTICQPDQVGTVLRKGGVRNTIKVTEREYTPETPLAALD